MRPLLQSPVAGVGRAGNFACARRTTGQVDCWGDSEDDAGSDVPSPIPGVSGATELSLSAMHACAATAAGVACWQRAIERRIPRQRPTLLPNTAGAHGLASYQGGVCILTRLGKVECRALSPGPGYQGHTYMAPPGRAVQLSVAEMGAFAVLEGGRVVELQPKHWPKPVDSTQALATLSGVVQVQAGAVHACALLSTGQVVCWGENRLDGDAYGLVGDGTRFDSPLPKTVLWSP